MRPDEQKLKATQKEGAKDEREDLENQRQPKALSTRDRDSGETQAGQGRVRHQDPNFNRRLH